MKLGIFGVSILGVLGVAQAAQAAPDWCASLGRNRIDASSNVDDMVKGDDPVEALPALALATCRPDGDASDRMDEIDAARARWSKALGLTEPEWEGVVTYARFSRGQRVDPPRPRDFDNKRAWSSYDPIDQYIALTRGFMARQPLYGFDSAYLADALGAHLSELGRLGFVRDCLDTKDVQPVRWAMCQADLARLDPAKMSAEVRANTRYDAEDKIRVRVAIFEGMAKVAAHTERVKKLIASDPGFAKVFEIATATQQEWAGRTETDAALLGLAEKMEDARTTNSRKAFEGCGDTTWAAWKTAVGGVPAKKLENSAPGTFGFEDRAMGVLLNDPGVYLAAVAIQNCAQGQDHATPKTYVQGLLGKNLQHWPGARGPRTATASAILTAGIEFDDRGAKLATPTIDRHFGAEGSVEVGGGGDGVVAKLTPAGATVTIGFKPDLFKEERCDQWKYSNRIIQIASDGSLVYDASCQKMITVTLDKSSAPAKVDADQMAGITKGMFVSIRSQTVRVASAKLNGPPTFVFGAKLK